MCYKDIKFLIYGIVIGCKKVVGNMISLFLKKERWVSVVVFFIYIKENFIKFLMFKK